MGCHFSDASMGIFVRLWYGGNGEFVSFCESWCQGVRIGYGQGYVGVVYLVCGVSAFSGTFFTSTCVISKLFSFYRRLRASTTQRMSFSVS